MPITDLPDNEDREWNRDMVQRIENWIKEYTPEIWGAVVTPGDNAYGEIFERLCDYCTWHSENAPNELWLGDIDRVREVIMAEGMVQGNRRALELFFEKYGGRLDAFASRISRQFGDDAWYKVLADLASSEHAARRLASYNGNRKLYSYLATAITWESRAMIRRWRREREILEMLAAEQLPSRASNLPESKEEECFELVDRLARNVFGHLTERERRAVTLYFFGKSRDVPPDGQRKGMTYEEVGRELGRNKGTVQRWLRRIAKRVLARLKAATEPSVVDDVAADVCYEFIQELRTHELFDLLRNALEDSQGGEIES